ncbi:MAG: RecX family transcriptional regulator [Eubacteriales bacterium]
MSLKLIAADRRAAFTRLIVSPAGQPGAPRQTFTLLPEDDLALGLPPVGTLFTADFGETLADRQARYHAVSTALRLLAAADQSRLQLTKKLLQRGVRYEHAAFAVRRMMESGYLKESEQVRRHIERQVEKLWGPLKITAYLQQKGYRAALIAEVMAAMTEEGAVDFSQVREVLLQRAGEDADEAQQNALLCKFGHEIHE